MSNIQCLNNIEMERYIQTQEISYKQYNATLIIKYALINKGTDLQFKFNHLHFAT